MKKFSIVFASLFMAMMLISAVGAASPVKDRSVKVEKAVANVEIILQNKCTRDVKYVLKNGATSTNGVVAKGDKVKLNVATGTQILVDGDVFMTVADGDAGQTFMVCR
jgi:hypothetical protein